MGRIDHQRQYVGNSMNRSKASQLTLLQQFDEHVVEHSQLHFFEGKSRKLRLMTKRGWLEEVTSLQPNCRAYRITLKGRMKLADHDLV